MLKCSVYWNSLFTHQVCTFLRAGILFCGLLLSTAPAVLTQNLNFFFFFFYPVCKCVHRSFTLWKRTGNVVPVSKNHTMNTCGRAEEQVRTHTRPVVLQRVTACGPVLKFHFADLRGPLHDNSCMYWGNTQWQETPAQSRYFVMNWIEAVSNYRKARTTAITIQNVWLHTLILWYENTHCINACYVHSTVLQQQCMPYHNSRIITDYAFPLI